MVLEISILLMALLAAHADPAPAASRVPSSEVPSAFVTVSRLGESDQLAAVREGELLSHRRATDPFGNTIRGPYKGLPAVLEHPTPTPAQPAGVLPTPGLPNAVSQIAATVYVPTLEKAVQELTIGAVNVAGHQILLKSRAVHEGDLLVLESGGRQFVVWVQNVGVRGVMFCDTDLQKHILKPFGSGPKELPGDTSGGISDIRNFLNKDAHQ